jgi:Phosphoribosyl-ATP pyrophosphohydrolase
MADMLAEFHERLLLARLDYEMDREKIAQELADVVYVAVGTAHAFAIDLDVALAEVHRAAMKGEQGVRADGDQGRLMPKTGHTSEGTELDYWPAGIDYDKWAPTGQVSKK